MQLAQCEPREIAEATPLLPLNPQKSAVWKYQGGISARWLMSAGDVFDHIRFCCCKGQA